MMRSSLLRSAAVLVALAASAPLHAQVAALTPVDEAGRDPAFARFRAELLDAVERRDTAFVLEVLAHDVLPDFGGDRGVEGFRRAWLTGERPPEERLWPVLMEVLRGGGVFVDDSTFVAPYTFAAFPEALDPFRHRVVTGAGVRVRAEPGLGGEVLTHLSHTVVAVPERREVAERSGREWMRIELRDGRRGWMAREYLKSPLDYRAVFVRRDGRWRLRSLVAGD